LNNVGRKGQKSVQFGFKVSEELAKKIEQEREIDETTLAGFFNDAIKFYIDYREKKRIDLWKMEKEKAAASGDPTAAETSDWSKDTRGGTGRQS
jgi:hypothetical protein